MHIKLSSVIHLLHEVSFGVLATQSVQLAGYPFATILPLALDEHHQPVFLLSGLAEHTKNLLADPRASLLVAEPGEQNVLKGARLTLMGDVQRFDASDELAARYLRYQPDARQYLDLGDFAFFRLIPKRARYIAGFGEMGWVEQAELENATALSLCDEENIFRNVVSSAPAGVHVLGIDCYGFDVEHAGMRERHQFANGPIDVPDLADVIKLLLASL
jgi:heme iron utilization protein